MQMLLNIFFVILCILLILIILLQSNRSSGMGLFGGGGSQSAFGANSADVLTKTTAVMVALFMLTAMGMAFLKRKNNNIQKIQEKMTESSDTVPKANDDSVPNPSGMNPQNQGGSTRNTPMDPNKLLNTPANPSAPQR